MITKFFFVAGFVLLVVRFLIGKLWWFGAWFIHCWNWRSYELCEEVSRPFIAARAPARYRLTVGNGFEWVSGCVREEQRNNTGGTGRYGAVRGGAGEAGGLLVSCGRLLGGCGSLLGGCWEADEKGAISLFQKERMKTSRYGTSVILFLFKKKYIEKRWKFGKLIWGILLQKKENRKSKQWK